jgi:hypothetical protein
VRVVVGLASVLSLVACGEASGAGRTIPSYVPGPSTPGATFSFSSDKGAHPVDYRTGEWSSPPNEFMIRESDNVIKIDVEGRDPRDYIRIELAAPARAPLQVGRYSDVRNIAKFPDGPGMQVISGSLGCGDDYGEFVIDRIERADGTLVALDAGFVQSCGGPDKPAFRGRLHYQS